MASRSTEHGGKQREGTEAGFNHHFTRPVEPDAITALLAQNDK
jgi:hypothetical protein